MAPKKRQDIEDMISFTNLEDFNNNRRYYQHKELIKELEDDDKDFQLNYLRRLCGYC